MSGLKLDKLIQMSNFKARQDRTTKNDVEEKIMQNEELRKQSWDFFQMQAGQRLTTFNFYIAISSLLSTGLAASFKPDICAPFLGIAFGLLLILFSFVFWKLDNRNRDLIKGAEASLKYFESVSSLEDERGKPHIAKRFIREEFDTSEKKKHRSWWRLWRNHYSYSECFSAVFMIFGIIGLVGFLISIVLL